MVYLCVQDPTLYGSTSLPDLYTGEHASPGRLRRAVATLQPLQPPPLLQQVRKLLQPPPLPPCFSPTAAAGCRVGQVRGG